MSLYDIQGNSVATSGDVTTATVKSAMLQAIAEGEINVSTNIGDTLPYTKTYFTSAIEEKARSAYEQMLAKYQTMNNLCVPFFLSTDQHSKGLEQHRWANNIDIDGMEFASINLGDTSNNVYEKATLDSYFARTKHVKNYIGVVGNHDKRLENEEPLDSQICKVFNTTNLKRTMISNDTRDCYSVIDQLRNVKWVVVDPFGDTDSTGSHGEGQPVYTISTNVAKWLIEELSENDNNDIVVMCHLPFCSTSRTRSEDSEGAIDSDVILNVAWEICLARKNKTNGSVTDDDGVTHNYDFSNCKTDMLCCLHGHLHEEVYSTANGLTCYIANSWSANYSCVFGLIDRLNKKLFIYQFDTNTYDELVLDI